MNRNAIIAQLEINIDVFSSVLKNSNAEEFAWRPSEGKWNLTEIISHLYDEEREDFRARLKHTLENPSLQLPPIDPAGWVTSRNYSANDPMKKFSQFLSERKHSIEWLKTTSDADWSNFYTHEKFGKMSAEMFLSEWLSHDMLHIRQILNIRYHFHREKCGNQMEYAGNW